MTVADPRRLTGRPPNARCRDRRRHPGLPGSARRTRRGTGGGPLRTWHARQRRERAPSWSVSAEEWRHDRPWASAGADSIRGRIVLIPIAIAINIVLGQTVTSVAQGPDLPRLHRHRAGRRPGRPDPGPRHRRGHQPAVDLRAARRRSIATTPRRSRSRSRRGSASSPASSAQWGFLRSRPNTDWGRIADRGPASSSSSSAASASTASCRSTRTATFTFFNPDAERRSVLHGPGLPHRARHHGRHRRAHRPARPPAGPRGRLRGRRRPRSAGSCRRSSRRRSRPSCSAA